MTATINYACKACGHSIEYPANVCGRCNENQLDDRNGGPNDVLVELKTAEERRDRERYDKLAAIGEKIRAHFKAKPQALGLLGLGMVLSEILTEDEFEVLHTFERLKGEEWCNAWGVGVLVGTGLYEAHGNHVAPIRRKS